MELTVFWTEFAKEKLDEIFEYYKLRSKSVDVARKLLDSIINHSIGLEKQPYIGLREELIGPSSKIYIYNLQKVQNYLLD